MTCNDGVVISEATMDRLFFSNFADYWQFVKHLSKKQRRVILRSLPKPQRVALEESYIKDGWQDLFRRNQMDRKLDRIREEFGIDLVGLRVLVLSGKEVYVKRTFWECVCNRFRGHREEHTRYIFGGYRFDEVESHPDEFCLVPNGGSK